MRLPVTLLLGALFVHAIGAPGQSPRANANPDSLSALTWNTDATRGRFVAVHGRRALVMGYPQHGLEVWAYPLQLISDYEVSFVSEDEAEPLAGSALLRHIEYRPDSVIRTYVGPDFAVRETLFVPLDKPGAILTYEVEGSRKIIIRASFVPSLNLMWPGALGGQYANWDSHLSGYVLSEPLHHHSATIGSPQTIHYEPVINRAIPQSDAETLVLEPQAGVSGKRMATIYIGYDAPNTAAGTTAQDLQQNDPALRQEARKHYEDLLQDSLQIETPDAEVNRALAWSQIALDQAWVCNPSLGCGALAGYGPSRRGRRPQYAWYFAGDGLVASDAWVASGAFDRARAELAFILKYQNAENGMIWHEISQGVPVNEWQRSYPYMFVHVDITFQFLAGLGRYIQASGDVAFLHEHQAAIEAAYRYCQSVIDPATALPRIPPGREGANEQDQMRDDIGLSSAWIAAAESMTHLAHLLGNDAQAQQAAQAADAARRSMASLDWDPAAHFWLAGHTASGEPMHTFRPEPTEVLAQHVFTPEQAQEALEKLTSPDFQTDWGVRSLSASSPGYEPSNYGKGSVSALGTASLAQGLWQQHWNLPALQMWQELLPWSTLDSEGHIHELLTGDLYHPEIESVPEQTWSSAGMLSATLHGLLGVQVDGEKRELTFAPHPVPQWQHVTLRNLQVAESRLTLQLTYEHDGISLDAENQGGPVTLHFSPELPLGARTTGATISIGSTKEHHASVTTQQSPTDTHADIVARLQPGHTRLRIAYRGGIQIETPRSAPAIGTESRELHLGKVQWQGKTLTLDAYVVDPRHASVTLHSDWQPGAVDGAQFERLGPQTYVLHLQPPTSEDAAGAYIRRKVSVQFASR